MTNYSNLQKGFKGTMEFQIISKTITTQGKKRNFPKNPFLPRLPEQKSKMSR